jgi:hypothetical protein
MSSDITPYLNTYNITNIRNQIEAKKASTPYYSTIHQVQGVITDYDTFPYPRYFRGVAESSDPIVAEREAGWRPRHDSCYRVTEPPGVDHPLPPNNCFQAPCSTVYPCYPEYLTKYSDKESLDLILNKTCIVQYR